MSTTLTAKRIARDRTDSLSSIFDPSALTVYAGKGPGMTCIFWGPAAHTLEEQKEECAVIKGISRRVIVVKSPDRRFFEEAIFIVREGAIGSGGVTAEQVVEEARRVADGFVKKGHIQWYQKIPAPGYVAAGALLATVLWSLALLL